MKHKMTEKLDFNIRAIADQLERTMIEETGHKHSVASKQYETILGEDLILCDVEEVEGKPVDPEKEYTMPTVMTTEVGFKQHYRRMKKAHERNGVEGICRYLAAWNLIDPEGIAKLKPMLQKIAGENVN